MPALALAVLWAFLGNSDTGGAREPAPRRVIVLLVAAIAFSWFGDGASFFFPMFDDELPAMLLCFGVAHLLYIWLFVRPLARRRVPIWTLAYAVWWGVMIAVLWTHLGALLVPVMVYGLVLGGTAVAATRGGAITAIGGAFFLASDTILAFRLFLPGGSESLAGPWIMLTYTIGQGLLAYGIMRLHPDRAAAARQARRRPARGRSRRRPHAPARAHRDARRARPRCRTAHQARAPRHRPTARPRRRRMTQLAARRPRTSASTRATTTTVAR
ncbi:MAG: lysoplasmalogenase [Microbacterium sp.]|nr:MAG: lysoplasmalogenase [Microbacterium sp.]